jgi:hypothetical protein
MNTIITTITTTGMITATQSFLWRKR